MYKHQRINEQAQIQAAKETAEGKITLIKKLTKRYLTYGVTMTSQLKHVIMLDMFIGSYSAIQAIMHSQVLIWYTNYHDHRFTLYI